MVRFHDIIRLGFQRIFRKEHIRRTTDQHGNRLPVTDGMRKNVYVDDYMGFDYQGPLTGTAGNPDLSNGDGLEFATSGFQILYHRTPASGGGEHDLLGKMAQNDPESLDLLLGVLAKYEPPY